MLNCSIKWTFVGLELACILLIVLTMLVVFLEAIAASVVSSIVAAVVILVAMVAIIAGLVVIAALVVVAALIVTISEVITGIIVSISLEMFCWQFISAIPVVIWIVVIRWISRSFCTRRPEPVKSVPWNYMVFISFIRIPIFFLMPASLEGISCWRRRTFW